LAACQVIGLDGVNLDEKISKVNGLFRVSSGLSWDRQTDFLSTELFEQIRMTLFNVEGLKIDEKDDQLLLVLSTMWLAMAKHLGLSSEDLLA
jgi:dimeric dUTPase (all-alpha-NTP-PPase superfamily)